MISDKPVCPDDHKHAETLTCVTQHRCHCAECMEAHRDYAFWRRHMHASGRVELIPRRRVPATGTRRRIQALMAIGWSQSAIARHLGGRQAQVSLWLELETVQARTHTAVAALYDRLQTTTPPTATTPERMSVHRTLALAQRRGYARPIDWDDIDHDDAPQTGIPIDVDEVRVELAVSGHRVELTTDERHLAVATLNRRGYYDSEIARMTGVDVRTILRDRQLLELPPVDEERRTA